MKRSKYLSYIGARVRARRELLALSQVTVATRARVHVNVVGRLERGTHNPTVVTLIAIARALRTTPQELL